MRLTASDGHEFNAYEVHPDGAAASVVIVQEIFGVNDHIRSVVDRYASFGYRAIAPAIFDRVEAGVELGYDEAGVARGREIAMQIAFEPALRDVAAAVEYARGQGATAGRDARSPVIGARVPGQYFLGIPIVPARPC